MLALNKRKTTRQLSSWALSITLTCRSQAWYALDICHYSFSLTLIRHSQKKAHTKIVLSSQSRSPPQCKRHTHTLSLSLRNWNSQHYCIWARKHCYNHLQEISKVVEMHLPLHIFDQWYNNSTLNAQQVVIPSLSRPPPQGAPTHTYRGKRTIHIMKDFMLLHSSTLLHLSSWKLYHIHLQN